MNTDGNMSYEWRSKIRTLLICVVLAAATFIAFAGVRNNDFVIYDDDFYITSNEPVWWGLNARSIGWAFTTYHMGNWHPLTWISHIIDCSVFGLNPQGHHFVSVGFHIANVVLLFLILKRMTGDILPSAFVAAVFGLHPLAVESVAWIAERKNVLSTFFALLTILAYCEYTRKPVLWRYVVTAIAFAAGLLSKPMLVTLPFVLILLDYWPLNRIDSKFSILNSLYEKLPLLIISGIICLVTYHTQASAGAMQDIGFSPMGLRAGNAVVSYIKYIGMVFYPAGLAPLYPLDLKGLPLWQIIAGIVILLIVTAAVILERNRRRFLITGWFWYLGTLVPVIGLVQVGSQAMADRYMYLPGIGIYIIVAWLACPRTSLSGAGEAISKLRLPKVIPATAGTLILVILLVMTRIQVGYWKDSASLCKRTLEVTRDNYIMQNNYGELLRNAGKLDEAIEHFNSALSIRPGCVEARENLGNALQEKGRDFEASAEFEIVLRLRPNNLKARNSYGVALAKLGKTDSAIEQFSEVLSADPYRLTALNNLYKVGADNGKLDKVLDIILDLQAKARNNYELYVKAGLIYGTQGKIDASIEQLETACRLTDDRAPEPLDYLSQAYAAKKNMERAVEAAQMALNAANEEGKKDLAEQIKRRLELYQQTEKPKE
jgi:tetratricopeptide (TPR) repeat protein